MPGVRFPCQVHAFVRVRQWSLMERTIYPNDLEHSAVNLIIHNWDLEIPVGEFGTHRSCQKLKIWNFPNSLVPHKFNSGCIGPIRSLKIICWFSVLGVPRLLISVLGMPRLLHSYLLPILQPFTVYSKCTYFLANKSTTLNNFGKFSLPQTNTSHIA